MSWWENDPVFGGSDTFRSAPRGMKVDDVQAAVRGDMFNSPGLPIGYAAKPGQQFGRAATENAQPFQNIVAHHTGSSTLDSALRTAQGDPSRGGANFGYHFYIDKDGSITQGAPMEARTNHVQAPFQSMRTARPDVGNQNSVGISFVGMGEQPTPQAQAAAENLSKSLMGQYGIQPQNVVGHGQIQNNRQTSEGMTLVNAMQGGQQPAVAQAPRPQFDMQSTAQAAPAAPQRKDWWNNDPVFSPKKDIGRGRALGEGIRSGVTFNFGDEISGVAAAGTAGTDRKVPFPVAAAVGAARLLKEQFQGQGGDATQGYEAGRDEVRAAQQAAQAQYPGTYMGGQIGGAIAMPAGGMLNAATLPARIGRGAAVGAGYGAIAGAGEGTDLPDRASRAAIGGATGAAIGGAAPPLVEGAIQGGRALINPLVNAVRGAVNPANEASRRVVTAIQRDAQADPNAVNRLTQQEFRAEQQAGSPVSLMDMGGETTRGLARSAANTSPEGRAALNQTINDRYEGQAGRVSSWFDNTFHYPNAEAQQRAIDQVERTVNRGNYARAYNDGNRTLASPGLDELSTSPAVQNAMRVASRSAQDRTVMANQSGGQQAPRNLQFWDYTRRELSDAASAARRAGRNEEAARLGDLSRSLNGELDRLVPTYGQARAGAAQFFGAENALEAGQNFVTQNFAAGAVRRQMAAMSPTERQLFQDGFVSRYVESLNKAGDRRNILNQIGESPAAREKLNMVLGQQRAGELEARLRVEGIMDLARGAVQGNSTTARQLAELGFAGGAGSLGAYGAYNMDPAQVTYAAVAGALLAGRRGIDQRVSRQVAQMLVSDNPQMIQRGIQLVSRNGRMMDALRTADRRIAVVGGGQAAPAPAMLQSPAVTRADE